MKEYIFGERNGIHIIDLQKTLKMFRDASRFVSELTAQGRSILFLGTKRQAQEAVAEEANRCGMFYVNHRWLGGTLTNWATLQKSMENMTTLPDAMFVIDSNAEEIAVREARRMGVPVVSIVDTNCNPEVVDWIIPGNDDALRAIRLFTSKISDAVIEGKQSLEQSQLAEAKSNEGAEGAEGGIDPSVDYKDTSKYESYEKSEGDFVDPSTLEQPFAADAALDPAAEVPDKDKDAVAKK